MNDWTRRRFLSAIPALPLVGSSLHAAPAPRGLRAGAAKANMTLPLGATNGGVILRGGPVKQVHDELHARCLVLDDGTTQLAFVICDLRMISRDLVDRAKRLAAAALGWPAEHMLVAATHTHAAPGLVNIQQGAIDRWYADFVVLRIADAIRRAAAQLAPARIGFGSVPKAHLKEIVRPLQEKEETIYVTKNSDAEDHVAKRFPHKKIKHVGNTLRPNSIEVFLNGMPNVFQPGKSAGLNATFHFTFTGREQRQATVVIKDQKMRVEEGHVGRPDLHVTADSQTWIGFLRNEKNVVWALLWRKIQLDGPLKLLMAFGKCFPSASARHEVVEILPPPSKLRGDPARFERTGAAFHNDNVKNDPATVETRWRGKLMLSDVVDETHEVKTFRFSLPNGGPIPFDYLPGQFVTLHVSPRGIPTKRSYTIASSPTSRDRIEITVKREGQGLVSQWLHDELKIGDEVEIEAPNGTFTFSGKEADRVVLVGGGVGITPLMSVVRYLAATNWPGKMHLILGFRSPRDFVFREELAELQARNANLGVTITMSGPRDEPWSGRVGRIDASLLASTVPDLTAHRVHVCGPPSMMDAVKAALVSLGVPHAQIKTEAFGTIKRDPTAKDAGSKEIAGRAIFLAAGVTAPVPVDATILDAADTAGVSIDNACRSGTCASCRVKLVSGQVTMAVEDALTDQDKAEGYILACQAKVQGDIEVDA